MSASALTSPTIIVHLAGGLGNQMFQYALGRHLALANAAALYLDRSAYDETVAPDPAQGIRACQLHHFAVAGKFIRFEKGINLVFSKIWYKFSRVMEKNRPYHARRHIIEPAENHFRFDPAIYNLKITGLVVLRGYWQSEKYLVDAAPMLRRELVVKSEPDEANRELLHQIGATNSVSIHVRHGDNANSVAANLGVLPLSYYETAVQRLAAGIANPHFFVFSDDIAWARQNLDIHHPVTYVEHNGDARSHEDLRLMTHCRHHILANSTFGWWGAWLGAKSGQIVYAPRRYYQNMAQPNPDLYPETWRLI